MVAALTGSEIISVDNLDLLLGVLPPHLREAIVREGRLESLIEIVLDLGRQPEARYAGHAVYLNNAATTREDLQYAESRVGHFTPDNRAGIERTLHRISAIRNRLGQIVGLTCRVGRAIFGTVDIIRDLVESGKSILLMGRPGVGKTTLLREAARVLADDFEKRVIVVDTSNEIAGDGDVPHTGIGRARRMQVPAPENQHSVMIEAVENHMPEVIVIDEIGTAQEALAARTIGERGVQLIATVHGNTLENLVSNPTLSDLVGGIQPVTLSDEEARRRGTQKTVLERKAPPTFETLVEIHHRDRLAVHRDVAVAVDEMLWGLIPRTELRERRASGEVTISEFTAPEHSAPSNVDPRRAIGFRGTQGGAQASREGKRKLRIYPYGISRDRLAKAIQDTGVPAEIVNEAAVSDLTLTLRPHARRLSKKLRSGRGPRAQVSVLRNNTPEQIENFLRVFFGDPRPGHEGDLRSALAQVEDAVIQVMESGRPVELPPQPKHIRRRQHLFIERSGLRSESVGAEPLRRVKVRRGQDISR
jgi:stage III sporulation protein SpoIIIAA